MFFVFKSAVFLNRGGNSELESVALNTFGEQWASWASYSPVEQAEQAEQARQARQAEQARQARNAEQAEQAQILYNLKSSPGQRNRPQRNNSGVYLWFRGYFSLGAISAKKRNNNNNTGRGRSARTSADSQHSSPRCSLAVKMTLIPKSIGGKTDNPHCEWKQTASVWFLFLILFLL